MTTIAISPSAPTATEAKKRSPARSALHVGKLTVFYLILTGFAAIFMVPYILAIFGSLKPANQILTQQPWALPNPVKWSNYSTTLFQQDFIRYLGNTALVTLILTVGQVVFSVIAAYAFSRLRFPGRDIIFWFYLITLMIPNIVTIIPLYTIIRSMHLIGTYWAIFLPYVFGTPYTIFLIRQFFMNIPQEVIDASKMDGCSDVGTLWRIVVPLSRPVIITATLIAFVFSWNNFLWPLIVSNPSHYVLTTGIANFQSSFGIYWNLVLAGAMITLLPLILIFIVFQRHIIRSIQLTQGH
ncbi:MAG TPA: carbohydrate ABC transporter permease [Acidimicrobiales bacterium]|nr:carbohydrate ABC transporter permease [Acidimicrobiales bacterium]